MKFTSSKKSANAEQTLFPVVAYLVASSSECLFVVAVVGKFEIESICLWLYAENLIDMQANIVLWIDEIYKSV